MSGIDVIIPTFRPGREFEKLIDRLRKQTVVPDNIIIVNTLPRLSKRQDEKGSIINFAPRPEKTDSLSIKGEDGFNINFYNEGEEGKISVFNIRQDEFDHGATRDYGIAMSDAQFIILMNQEALPLDARMIEELVKPFEDKTVACSYGRQFCRRGEDKTQQLLQKCYFPGKPYVKSGADLKRKGMETYFCSNACAAYRRSVYNELGGFGVRTIFNEDIVLGAKIIGAGYKIAYTPYARVRYHKVYDAKQSFQRSFDLGVLSSQYRDLFKAAGTITEETPAVKRTAAKLMKDNNYIMLTRLLVFDVIDAVGYEAGINYEKIPAQLIRKLTLNKEYWRKGL